MRALDRLNYLKQSGKLSWNILVKGKYDFTYDLMPVHSSDMPLKKRLNVLRAGVNLIHRRIHPWSLPLHIHVELTNYCNLKCPVCPTGSGRLSRKPTAIDPALFERLVNELEPYILTMSLWGWGEPLLHPQLTDILRITQNRGITTFLSTNGQNLDDETVRQALLQYPPTYLFVCLDGLTDEINDIFRTGSKLAPALEGVKQLAKMKRQNNSRLPVLQWRYIVMKQNEHELPELPEFAAENQFDELIIRTLSIIDAPEDIHHQLIPDNERYRAYGYTDDKRIGRTDFICEKAFTFPAVFADGTVVACDQDCNAQRPIGSIADGSSFTSVWWNEQAARVRKEIRDNPEELSFCKNCPFRDRSVKDCNIQYHTLHSDFY